MEKQKTMCFVFLGKLVDGIYAKKKLTIFWFLLVQNQINSGAIPNSLKTSGLSTIIHIQACNGAAQW